MFGLKNCSWPMEQWPRSASNRPRRARVRPRTGEHGVCQWLTGPAQHRRLTLTQGAHPQALSLSFDYKSSRPVEASFPFTIFLSYTGKPLSSTHRRLAAVWLYHWAIPSAQLILTSVRFFCPRFQNHRPTPLSSTTYNAGDFCRCW
jgi:hypothetical protein